LFFSETVVKNCTDEIYEIYGSLAYDDALLLRVPLCVSRAFLYLYFTFFTFYSTAFG